MKPVCIGFCTFNRLELTKKMFDSFSKNTNTPYNLTIIDNGSTDGTVDWLNNIKTSEYCKSLNIIYNADNKGIAYARNQSLLSGLKYNPDYFCTLDNDVELNFNWLNDCIKIMENNSKWCIGVNLEGVDYPTIIVNELVWQEKPAGNLGTAISCFPSSLVKDIGYFKSYKNLYGEEDANYFFRARRAGYKMGYLVTPGKHIGEEENNDDGTPTEYREWKTKCHKENLSDFIKDCHDYCNGNQSIYLEFKELI